VHSLETELGLLSSGTFQGCKSSEWHSGTSSGILNNAPKLYLVVLSDHFPEPLHRLVVVKVLYIAVSLPVVYVDLTRSAHLRLKLFRGEVLYPVNRNDRVEALTEFIQLRLYTLESYELALQVNELLFVLIRDSALSATWLQFPLYLLRYVGCEVLLDNFFVLSKVGFHEELQRVVYVEVDHFKISKLNLVLLF